MKIKRRLPRGRSSLIGLALVLSLGSGALARAQFGHTSLVPPMTTAEPGTSMLARLVLAPLAWGFWAQSGPPLVPSQPLAVINEVLFDPIGAAGSEGTYSFVELYFKRTTNTSGMAVTNQDGAVRVDLPDLDLPPESYLVVLFGPNDPELDTLDPALGPVVITSGHSWGDHLGTTQGGVRLLIHDQVVDQIHWGTDAGSEQPFFDLSFSTGSPIAEGDSLGRSSTSAWTGRASDFAVAGGKNAMGVTPGERNTVDPPPRDDLLLYQEHVVNSLFETLSNSFDQRGWLQVAGSTPSITSYASEGGTTTIAVQHSFTVRIHGEPVELAGSVSTTVTSSASGFDTWEQYVSSGEVKSASGQYGLSFDMTRRSAGAHSLQPAVDYTTSFQWTHQAIAYSASLEGTHTTTRTGQDTVVVNDSRQGTDWGGLQKSCSLQATFLRLSDGVRQISSTLQRTFPSQLPYPGSVQSGSQIETLREDLTTTTNGLAELESGWITLYEQKVDDTVIRALRPGELGTIATTHAVEGPVQTAVTTYTYPLNQFGSPVDMVVKATMTLDESDPSKAVYYGQLQGTTNGNQIYVFDFFLDPPQDQEKPGLGRRLLSGVGTAILCGAAGVGAEATIKTPAGRRAMVRMFGKAGGAVVKKSIPIVGWGVTAACVGKAITDF